MNEEEVLTISSEAPEQPGMDYNLLRKEGLAHLQRLAGKLWTDYNSHDPGVTILEQLCYVLTDLSYRIDYDMPDLLAVSEGDPYRCLYTPAEILTTKPVTITDLRKVLVDIEGVQNAWIEALPYPDNYFYYDSQKHQLTFEQLTDNALKTKGFYRVLLQKDKEANIEDDLLLQQADKCVQSNRKLAEDFRELRLLDTQKVHLKATIEIAAVDDADLLLANIYRKTADYMSPYLRFHTLDEMLNSGKRIDEVMEGPALQHGFIDTDEIEQLDKRTDLRISDIVHEIMKVEGVKVIKNITLYSEGEDIDWVLNLDPRKAPEFDAENTEIVLVRDDLKTTINRDRTLTLYHELKEDTLYPLLEEKDRNFLLPEGDDRAIENYAPFQNYFPAPYGVGTSGLASSDPGRKGQTRQLKAYLLFFEQLLANYFSQVAHFKDLMDFHNPEIKTYFAQTLSGLPGLETVLQNPDNYEEWLNTINKDEAALDRKNRFLDHLLARFCEEFTDYALIVYGSVENEWYNPPEKQVYDKQTLLKEYPENSAGRAHAFNYTQPGDTTDNVSGLEKRVANLLGIPKYHRRSMLQDFELVKTQIDAGYEGVEDNNIYTLLEAGLSREHYQFNESTHKIEIIKELTDNVMPVSSSMRFTDPNVLAATHETYTEITKEKAIDELIAQWQQWNSDLEGFYMMEHLLLCPQTARQGSVFLEYASAITATRHSKIGYGVRCTAPGHNLMHHEEIQIVDARYDTGEKDGNGDTIYGIGAYNGTYRVYNVQKDYFEIDHPDIMASSNEARWVRTSLYKEPYSLQLSFVLPDWPARFRSTSFREFIAQTIRRETPAHIQVNVHWFSRFTDIPDATWAMEDIKVYMNRLSIPYTSTDKQDDLLNKIPEQTTMEQWEEDYFQWLQKKAIQTGQPDESWSEENTLTYMQTYGIKSSPGDTITDLRHKTDRFVQNIEKWKLLYTNGTPDKSWSEKDLRTLMDMFGMAYHINDAQQDLLETITKFKHHFQKWWLLKNTVAIDASWTVKNLRKWMNIFRLPHKEKTLEKNLLQNIAEFREKAREWLDQTKFPDDSWTNEQLKTLMKAFTIPYTRKDTRRDLQHKLIHYDASCRQQAVWCSQPGAAWALNDLKLYMSGFGIPNAATKEACLNTIEQTEKHYQKWALLQGEPHTWTFPENNWKWTKTALQHFADEFDIVYGTDDTKTELVTAITYFEQQLTAFSDPDSNNVQYHAGRLLEYLRMGNIPFPYAFNEVDTIQFNANQHITMFSDHDLVNSGQQQAMGFTAKQTIEMWIKPRETGPKQKLYNRATENVTENVILNGAGVLQYYYTSSNHKEFSDTIPTDRWTHVAVVREDTNVSFFINGIDTGVTLSISGLNIDIGETLNTFEIGIGNGAEPNTGKIAEVRLWDTARTPEEIKANMSGALTGIEEGLQGYWKLNETLGNIAIDSTANANHGIMAEFLSDQEINEGLGFKVYADPENIQYQGQSSIKVRNSQPGVWYQLRVNDTNTYWGSPQEGTGDTLTFEVSGLEYTETFNVLAGKTTDHQLNGLGGERVQLANTAEIQIQPKTDLKVTPLSFTINYDDTVTVQIMGSQEGVSYQLHLYDDGDIGTETGDSKDGNNGLITLTSGTLDENTQLCIVPTNK